MLYVTKRNGQTQNVHFDKITDRIKKLIINDKEYLDPVLVAQKVVASLYPGITTEELDIESARICVNLSTTHPSYGYLGGHILISNLHKKTSDSFSSKMIQLSKENNNMNEDWLNVVIKYQDEFDKMMDYSRDYMYDYFGYKTLEKAYLLKIKDNIIERPQDMFMRVAITLHFNNYEIDLQEIKKTYDFMSQGYYTHATPTLFNSANKSMQLSSCFLLGTNDDLTDITVTWNSCAQISKWAGGIGLHVSNIRGKNSIIKSTGGRSNGLVPFLKVFNDIARWIDQGGKRPGSIAIYLEPHHPDIEDFLELRKNFGEENKRARDLFLALWISDLFMKQVEIDSDWYLLSDDECPGLTDVIGDDYEKLYWSYVEQKKYRKVLKARELWLHIMESQIETGMPYIAFKDTINKKCNQNNLGTIKSSNLCCEITEFSNHEEYAVCNLASIALKQFVKPYNNLNEKWIIYSKEGCKFCEYAKKYMTNLKIEYEERSSIDELKQILKVNKFTWPQIFVINDNKNWTLIGGWNDFYKYTKGTFDYNKLYDVAYNSTLNLNSVIDVNYYPVPQTKLSNMKHRPIGLGIQGLADAIVLLKIPYDSEECLEFNSKVMETIYLASMTASNDLAKSRYELMVKLIKYNFDHPEFYDKNLILENEEMNKLYHILKPNKYELNKNPESTTIGAYSSFDGSQFSKGIFQFDLWSVKTLYEEKWNLLKKNVIKYGTRNSLLTSLMPTASTSQILGNNECFEFFTNNIYTRNTQAGDFVMVNKYLVSDLNKVGLWNTELKDKIIADNGSIQNLDVPDVFKELYKTIWEIKQVWVLKGAASRGPFVDQTQSMNIFMAEPDYQRLGSSHFWAWKNGLKTGMYYLRTKPSSEAIKITVSTTVVPKENSNCETCSA